MMISCAVWAPVLLLLLCEGTLFGKTPAPPIVTIRSEPEAPYH